MEKQITAGVMGNDRRALPRRVGPGDVSREMNSRYLRTVVRLRAPSVLSALIIVLALAAVVTAVVPATGLGQDTDEIAAWTDVIQTAAIIGAAVLSYYRFSLNRTFTPRAGLSLDVHRARSPAGEFEHSLVLKVHNIGAVTLVDPHITVRSTARRSREDQVPTERVLLEIEPDPGALPDTVETVEPTESTSFFVQSRYPSDTWLVTYEATVALHNRRSWTEYLTVDCAPPDPGST